MITTFPPTDKQIGYAEDISKHLGIPMPKKYDMVTYAQFIASNLDEYHHKRLNAYQPTIDPMQPTIDEAMEEHQQEPQSEPAPEEKPKKTSRARKKLKEPAYADSLPYPSIGTLPDGMESIDSDLIRIAEKYGAAIIIVNKVPA